ncbi:hypothetical protein ACFL0T_06650 [Candidatus Omnitrophota bacterium]
MRSIKQESHLSQEAYTLRQQLKKNGAAIIARFAAVIVMQYVYQNPKIVPPSIQLYVVYALTFGIGIFVAVVSNLNKVFGEKKITTGINLLFGPILLGAVILGYRLFAGNILPGLSGAAIIFILSLTGIYYNVVGSRTIINRWIANSFKIVFFGFPAIIFLSKAIALIAKDYVGLGLLAMSYAIIAWGTMAIILSKGLQQLVGLDFPDPMREEQQPPSSVPTESRNGPDQGFVLYQLAPDPIAAALGGPPRSLRVTTPIVAGKELVFPRAAQPPVRLPKTAINAAA